MEYRRIEIRLSDSMARAAELLAREEDRTVGQILRDLLAKEITRRSRAKPPVRADERLVAPLRARLAADFAHASGWDALQQRLRAKGFVLRVAGGGLALHDWPGDRRLCKASELGFSYGRLMQRFRAPFPGHTHAWPQGRVGGAAPHPEDDDPVLIEPCD